MILTAASGCADFRLAGKIITAVHTAPANLKVARGPCLSKRQTPLSKGFAGLGVIFILVHAHLGSCHFGEGAERQIQAMRHFKLTNFAARHFDS